MKNYGFTLIELLVVISILGVISGLGIASLVSYSRAATMDNAAKDVALMLTIAKQKAYAQVKPINVGNCDTLTKYEVDLNNKNISAVCMAPVNPANSYVLYAWCLDASSNAVCTKISEGNLPNYVSFDAANSVNNFSFPLLTGGITGGSVTGTPIQIDAYGSSKIITVYNNGTIKTN